MWRNPPIPMRHGLTAPMTRARRAGLAAVADARRQLQDARDQQGGLDLERQERWS